MKVQQATIDDLDDLAPLFDAYRRFYGQAEDLAKARDFLLARFQHNESILFIARDDADAAVGFAQLYPSFTSTRCGRIYSLNDLFVAPSARGTHVGSGLLSAAADFGRRMGALRLTLSTAIDNAAAQRVYERAGWTRDDSYITYDLAL